MSTPKCEIGGGGNGGVQPPRERHRTTPHTRGGHRGQVPNTEQTEVTRVGHGVTFLPPCVPPPSCSFTICHKTEVMRNTLNPVWPAFAIPVRALCNGDYDR